MRRRPAIAGGKPVRPNFLPYGLHDVGRAEERAVLKVLRHGWLTAGPEVKKFEAAFAAAVGAKHAVAVATGTAALDLSMLAMGCGPGTEVITSPLTFVATANAAVRAGARPILADIDPETLNIDPRAIERRVGKRTKLIVPVHLTGLPCDMDSIRTIAAERKIEVLEDACHAVGSVYKGRPVGSGRGAQCFSFHPVKNITTAEGAIVTTTSARLAEAIKVLRFHGFREDYLTRNNRGALGYPRMHLLGTKSVITDMQAALGLVQLARLNDFTKRRQQLATRYNAAFSHTPGLLTPVVPSDRQSSWHLYIVRLDLRQFKCSRDEFMEALRAENIGTSVHYLPVHLQPFYRRRFGYRPGDYPNAEREYRRMITLPLFPKMTDEDQQNVVDAVTDLTSYYRR